MEKDINKVIETIQDNSFAKFVNKLNEKHTENTKKTSKQPLLTS